MCLVDANIVLRYVLNDHPALSHRASDIPEKHKVILLPEIICEIVYVLQKVYHVPRKEIQTKLCELIDENLVTVEKLDTVKQALSVYCTKNLDIVDAFLCAYHAVQHIDIFIFDDKLMKCLNSQES